MAGVTVGQLADLYYKTSQSVLSGPMAVMNEAEERSYLLSWIMGGEQIIQGGPRLTDWILFDAGNTAAFYLPGTSRSYTNPQFENQVESAWRFLEDYITILDVEDELNTESSDEARTMKFKDVMRFKEVAYATRINRKMEDALLSQPDATKQEVLASSTVTTPVPEPYSIFTFVNEFGGPTTALTLNNGTGLPNGFTTIENQNPTTQTGWRCQQIAYDGDLDLIATSTVNPAAHQLLSAMSLAIKACGFDEMPYKPSESTPSSPLNSEYCFFGSIEGVNYFEKIQRAAHDHFRQIPTDPTFQNLNIPYYSGIPVKYISRWSAAAVFPTSGVTAPAVGSGVVELSADNAGPRFALLGRRWLKCIFHQSGNFFIRPKIVPSAQPDTTVMLAKIWYQNWCRSRRRQAFIYPVGGDVTL